MNTHPYVVRDTRTNAVVGRYRTLKTACRAADRKDNEYGAYRYVAERDPNATHLAAPQPIGMEG